jgi:putative ABC transport system permease protein
MSVVVKTSSDPLTLASTARDQVWAIDSNIPVNDMRQFGDYVADAMGSTRFMLLLMSLFGGLALVLASVGIYGVISYAVRQRSHEFGVRMALGASPKGLVKSVLYQGARLLAVSILLGIGVSVLLSRSLTGMLFGFSPTDVSTYALVSVVLAAVALLACYLPARRSARIDPVATLRAD